MAPHQRPESWLVPLLDLAPLHYLNEFRKLHGLGPSRNLISSIITETEVDKETQLENNSPAYHGNKTLRRNICADISQEQSCRLWIMGLPPTCTVHQLLSCIRGIGPIFACHLTPPRVDGTKIWETSAASLTFFTADAANKFLARHIADPFTVGGFKTKVVKHMIKTKGVSVNGRSRVLRIVGDPDIVQPELLYCVITEDWGVNFDTDYIHFNPGTTNEIIWAFGSFRAQAHIICVSINTVFEGRAQAIYIADPCIQG
ncbi:hypothetical protein F5B22DRAFT_651886 [Xylaria bambusicola]|uniref:uncharacterized protein n=1 Tax=Xylaria bambusicola TaxID=326684 RepID=UPI0020088C2E|nr:uncharacterized protein F5B22DRAFT_651886 [Xylaria bambusicola]KAI0505260.1 hypothetical protein F5B22DRAFT_651886 [Xylaria bambusicola]